MAMAGQAAKGGCLVAAALLLAGCGDGAAKPSAPELDHRTTVLMMRHCARSMPEEGIYDDAQLPYFNNYTNKVWPPFNIPDFYCTDRGEKIVQEQGEWYKAHGDLPVPVSVLSDNVERDIVTGKALLRGLGVEVNNSTFSTNHGPFESAEGSPSCPKFTTAELKAAINAQLGKYPYSPNLEKWRDDLFALAGEGKAGNWVQHPCELANDTEAHWWAPLTGACNVANEFAERLLMESATGLDIGWGNVKPEQVPEYLHLHAWYLQVALFAPELQKRKSASIAWAILEALEDGKQGTKVFAGHDTNQGGLNAVLGLLWNPAPWPHNATMPGSALRFDREVGSDTVTMSYVFVDDFTKGGGMRSVPASINGFAQGTVSLTALRKLVEANTEDACRTDKSTAFQGSVVV